MRPAFTILYEDQRGPSGEHGLHHLIVASVIDLCGADFAEAWRFHKRLEPRCMKGIDSLLRTLRQDLPDITRDGRQVAAVVDTDVIRDKLGLAPAAPVAEVEAAIHRLCQAAVQPRLCLLDRNTETLLRIAGDCAREHRRPVSEELLQRACDKDRLARDLVLRGLFGPEHTATRECIRTRLPALGRLLTALTETLKKPH